MIEKKYKLVCRGGQDASRERKLEGIHGRRIPRLAANLEQGGLGHVRFDTPGKGLPLGNEKHIPCRFTGQVKLD